MRSATATEASTTPPTSPSSSPSPTSPRHRRRSSARAVRRTAPQARRPFQGWRYLEPKDAPADMSTMDAGEMPEDLALKLREMGAW